MLDHTCAPAVSRKVTPVLDLRSGVPVEVAAATLLDPLSAGEVALLRREICKAKAEGHDAFRCSVCERTLYLTTKPLEPGRTGGTRTLFAHHDSRDCPLTDARALHPDEIDRARFDGKQEGARHMAIKDGLAESLRRDPAFSDVEVERPIRVGESWRRPDVGAMTQNRMVVFEVQLASLQLPRMMDREAAYEEAGIELIWVVDGDSLDQQVWRQGCQDMVAARGGRIVAFGDREIAPISLGHGTATEAMCELVTVRETARGFELDRDRMPLMAAIERIAPADPASRPPLATDRFTRDLFAALRAGEGIDPALEALCDLRVPGVGARDAWSADVPRAIAALGTLMTGMKCDSSGFRETDAAAILNVFLDTGRYRVWAPLLQDAARVSPRARSLLARASTARKLRTALSEQPVPGADPIPRWRPLFAHLFPQLRGIPSVKAGRPA